MTALRIMNSPQWINIFEVEPKENQDCMFLFDDEIHIGFPVYTSMRVIKWHWYDYCHDEYLNQEYMSDKETIKWWYPIPNLFTRPGDNK